MTAENASRYRVPNRQSDPLAIRLLFLADVSLSCRAAVG